MRIIVSGAAGFIGSHMCDRLLLEGHSVIGTDNFLTGSMDNLSHLETHPGFRFTKHDVNLPINGSVTSDAVVLPHSTLISLPWLDFWKSP